MTVTTEVNKIREEISRNSYVQSLEPPKDKFIKVGGIQIY